MVGDYIFAVIEVIMYTAIWIMINNCLIYMVPFCALHPKETAIGCGIAWLITLVRK